MFILDNNADFADKDVTVIEYCFDVPSSAVTSITRVNTEPSSIGIVRSVPIP